MLPHLMAIDTIAIADDLRAHGAEDEVAKSIAQNLLKAHEGDPSVTRLYVDAKVEALRAETRKGFADVHGAISDLKSWTIGTVLGTAALSVTVLAFLLRK